jgi:hypothetical protein
MVGPHGRGGCPSRPLSARQTFLLPKPPCVNIALKMCSPSFNHTWTLFCRSARRCPRTKAPHQQTSLKLESCLSLHPESAAALKLQPPQLRPIQNHRLLIPRPNTQPRQSPARLLSRPMLRNKPQVRIEHHVSRTRPNRRQRQMENRLHTAKL